MLNITPTVMIPTMLQNLMGYPDSMIGILLAARGAGMVLGFFIVAQIAKVDPRIGMIFGVSPPSPVPPGPPSTRTTRGPSIADSGRCQ